MDTTEGGRLHAGDIMDEGQQPRGSGHRYDTISTSGNAHTRTGNIYTKDADFAKWILGKVVRFASV